MHKKLLELLEKDIYEIEEICNWGHTGGMPFLYTTDAPVSKIIMRVSNEYCVVLSGMGVLIPSNFFKILEKANEHITLKPLNILPDDLEEELWEPSDFQQIFSNHLDYEDYIEYINHDDFKLKYRCLKFIFKTSKKYFINLAKTFDKLYNNRDSDNSLILKAPKSNLYRPSYINISFNLSNCRHLYFTMSLSNKYDLFPKFSLQSDHTLKLEKVYYKERNDKNERRIMVEDLKDLKETFKELDSDTYKEMLEEIDVFKFHLTWERKLKPLFFTNEDDKVIQTQLTFQIENGIKYKEVLRHYSYFELMEHLGQHLHYSKFVLGVNEIEELVKESPKWFLNIIESSKIKNKPIIHYYDVETYLGLLKFMEHREFNKVYEGKRDLELERERERRERLEDDEDDDY